MTVRLTTDHSHVKFGNLEVTIRPISSDDKQIEAAFVRNLSAQSKHDRFLEGIRELSPAMLTQMCDIDYVNNMAYVATIQQSGKEKEIGVCRYVNGSNKNEREIAIAVADEYQHLGIGTELFNHLLIHARANCIKRLFSIDLRSNIKMREFALSLGMKVVTDPEEATQVIYSIEP